MSKELVLVAEDDVVYADVLRRRLETMGYQVAGIAVTGQEALEQARQMRPDIVLMDRELKSVLLGPDAGNRIHHELDIPVVYMTSHITEMNHALSDPTKNSLCVVIPCSNSELKRSIEFALQEHKQKQYVRQLELSHWETNEELECILDAASHDLRGALINLSEVNRHLRDCLLSPLKPENPSARTDAEKHSQSAVLEKEIAEFLEMIPPNLDKMHRILDGLLKLSRAARTTGVPELVDVRQLIQSLIQAETHRNNTELQIVIGDIPACCAELPHVRKVFSQLILNAVQNLSEDHPGRIQITGRREGKQSIYCVEDNGIGISELQQPTIFTPFCPIRKDASRREGLGLSIVRRIIHRYQGRAWVESAPGCGSRFYVSFPAE